MVKIIYEKRFNIVFSKIKDKSLKDKIIKQIEKIKTKPDIGKPMRYHRKGSRELYLKPYRLSYFYNPEEDIVFILDFYHKRKQ